MTDRPPYTPARFIRCVAHHLAAVGDARRAQTVLGLRMAAALAQYWEKAARKAQERC